MGIMAKTDLTNQRQVTVEEYVRSGNHLDATKKALDTKTRILFVIRLVSFAGNLQKK